MAVSGKLSYGLMGFFLGGPVGAIIGAAIGHTFDIKEEAIWTSQGRLAGVDTMDQLITSVIILAAKLAKADGIVSSSEVEVLDQFLKNNRLDREQREIFAKIYNEAKKDIYGYEETARDLARFVGQLGPAVNQEAFVETLFHLMFMIASADGKISEPEIEFIRKIATIFSFSESSLQQFEEQYFTLIGGSSSLQLTEAYKILNSKPEDSDETIKKSYRKLILKFHPDRIHSKELAPEFMDFAQQKSGEIITAYETVMNCRNNK